MVLLSFPEEGWMVEKGILERIPIYPGVLQVQKALDRNHDSGTSQHFMKHFASSFSFPFLVVK